MYFIFQYFGLNNKWNTNKKRVNNMLWYSRQKFTRNTKISPMGENILKNIKIFFKSGHFGLTWNNSSSKDAKTITVIVIMKTKIKHAIKMAKLNEFSKRTIFQTLMKAVIFDCPLIWAICFFPETFFGFSIFLTATAGFVTWTFSWDSSGICFSFLAGGSSLKMSMFFLGNLWRLLISLRMDLLGSCLIFFFSSFASRRACSASSLP